jgi:hypothetical protein
MTFIGLDASSRSSIDKFDACVTAARTNEYIHLFTRVSIRFVLGYLSNWYDMREQVQHDRTHVRHLLHLSQDIIRLTLRFKEDYSHTRTSLTHICLVANDSLAQIRQRIVNEIEFDDNYRHVTNERMRRSNAFIMSVFVKKLDLFRTDLHLAEQELHTYITTYEHGPSTTNLHEYLQSTRDQLEQLTYK